MKDLRQKLLKHLVKYSSFYFISLIVLIFFWKFFLKGLIPIPGDFVIGTYFPWLNYKWGYSVGVPVKNPITTDVVSFSYPMRILAINQIKNIILPLWNPYILTGIPLLANFQSAPFSITTPFYYFLGVNYGWGMQVISQHLLTAFFMFMLLKHFRLSSKSSIFGSIIFTFSGFNLIWPQLLAIPSNLFAK